MVAKGRNTVTYKMDVSSVYAMLDRLEEDAESVIRPAAQAGAEVVYQEARRLVGRSTKPHYFYGTSYKKGSESKDGRYKYNPGHLRDSIYQVYSRDNSSKTVATYHVSWNMKKAPYGLFVERGMSPFAKQSKPFIRPAIVNSRDKVIVAMELVVAEKLGNL
jgi:hypothetical protein